MTKAKAIHDFWASFGLKAYEETTVPTGESQPEPPYITYASRTDSIGNVISLTGSVWYRSMSWLTVEAKAEEIARKVGESGFYVAKVDGGYLWITKGSPFAQRIADPNDDTLRRIYINLQGEFLTEY